MFPDACQGKEKKNLLEKQLRFGIIKKNQQKRFLRVTQQKVAFMARSGQEGEGERSGFGVWAPRQPFPLRAAKAGGNEERSF